MAIKTTPAAEHETETLLQPPPSYNAATTYQIPSSSSAQHPAGPSSLPPHLYHHHEHSHSQESAIQAADRRARRRVLGALAWGFAIWIAVGLITGGIVIDATNRGARVKAQRA
ncbi:hypothetical protein BCR35DRAFT_308757 [Leucosporidium creatinivorum]|uniref:Uncharacterized protein n=1 Tax=Leucosporidium creatinivorum TaxID=106004 RepID=A0A1Y2DX00_9BASI|nr:hypothetical protein BCR35DRAFT_308757 [Leucosporidium creatinivorum]